MWSSKHQAAASTAQSDADQCQLGRSKGATHISYWPIPVQEDGTLELDLDRLTHVERVASVPLYHSGVSRASNGSQENGGGGSEKSVQVYVNQQGHTVKLAQLAALPSSYSTTSKVMKNCSISQERNGGISEQIITKSKNKEKISSTSSGIRQGERNSSGIVNSVASRVRSADNSSSKKFMKFSSTKSNQVNSNPQKVEVKTLLKNKQNIPENLDLKGSKRLELDSKEDESENGSKHSKDDLNSGLKKIMADLAVLDLPIQSQTPFEAGSGELSLNYLQSRLTSNPEAINAENGKENDSPCKESSPDYFGKGESSSAQEIPFQISLSASRSIKGSSDDMAHILKTSKLDSKKSSNSSLNSISKANSIVESVEPFKPQERKKSYDPEKARQYIRQQKQERLNKLKAERERQQTDLQARRQKLNELSRTSLKLVKASIKRKPSQFDTMSIEDQSMEHEKDHLSQQPVKETGDEIADSTNVIDNSKKPPTNTLPNLTDQYSTATIPLSLDDSNAQLIKDICEMKDKIEAMAKSLQTTIQSSRGPPILPPQSNRECNVRTNDQSESKHISKEEKCSVTSPTTAASTDSLLQPPYLNSLTSNLRKMRESLQSVLIQSEIKSSTSSTKSKTGCSNSVHHRHRRFSSTCSDSAFEVMRQEENNSRLLSLDGHLETNLLKRKITTGFPTLPVAETENISFQRRKYQRTSTESEMKNTVPPMLLHDISSASALRTHEKIQNPTSNKCDADVSHSELNGHYPDWLEPYTSKPYPINFISAVKRKLTGSTSVSTPLDEIRSDPPPEVQPNLSTTTVNNLARTSTFSSGHTHLNLPPFVTVRDSKSPDICPVSWANTLNVPSSLPPNSHAVEKDVHLFGKEPTVSNGTSSILNALNLEEMQAEFVRALNPVCSSDVTPAEKPLSAPNTPAKISLKLVRPSLSRAGHLSFDAKHVLKETVQRSAEEVSADNAPISVANLDNGSAMLSNGNNELVPPNVHLGSGRLERKKGSSDCWVSHSRGSSNNAPANAQEETSSSVQTTSSSRDTFEVGHVFNPTALHLQFQAELNILDSFNESLCQVMEVEKVCAVALARHEALSEFQPSSVPKGDKAIDVQTSLTKSPSEISSVNYKRGSGNPNDITVLNTDTMENESKDDQISNSVSLPVPVKDSRSSPSSTVASETLGSSIRERISDFAQASQDGERKTSPASGNSANSIEVKSASEDIYTTSDSILEEVIPQVEEAILDQSIFKGEKLPDETGTENMHLADSSKPSNNQNVTLEKSFSADVSLNSVLKDSTFTGDDALIIDSLQSNDHHIFPTLVSGEDMFQFNLQMLEQLMHEEELRVQHRNTLLKLRMKVLGEMARTEVAALDLEKKRLREKGEGGLKDQMTALRKKQRGIMLRFQQQREEIERVRRTEELAWQERRLMYLQQMHLIRMQISTHVMLHKFEKCGGNSSKKNRLLFSSIQVNRNSKSSQKSFVQDTNSVPAEMAAGLAVTHSSSVSLASFASEISKSSAVSNSSRKAIGGAGGVGAGDNNGAVVGDSESSHLEERVLKGLNELESRCGNLKEREKVLHERRQSVEQIIQWRRKLEEEERRLRDVERQAHSRHRTSMAKHTLRDRSTSPFQFLEHNAPGSTASSNNGNSIRTIPEITRNGRSNVLNSTASASGSPSITEEVDSSIPEEIGEHTSKLSAESTQDGTNIEHYANESFESEVSEVKTQESQTISQEVPHSGHQREQQVKPPIKIDSESEARFPRMSERSNKYPGVTIKVPLSPRLQRVQRRRYSSGSDDSMVLSQTETCSEQSDIEGRISALSEQLHQCKAEAERLRREAKRTRNERLIAKEQSLHKQLQAYETYISQLRRNLEAELKQSSVPIVRPQIKQPRVSPGKVASRRQDADLSSTPGSDRSALQVTSPEAASTSLHRIEIETEFKEVENVSEAVSTAVSEGASEIASEAASEVPSEVPSDAPSEVPSDVASEAASEVSENSSLLSQDAPSLVAYKAIREALQREEISVSNKEEGTKEVISDSDSENKELSALKSIKYGDIPQIHTETSNLKEDRDSSFKSKISMASLSLDSMHLDVPKSENSGGLIERDTAEARLDKYVKSESVLDTRDDLISDEKDEVVTDNKDDVTASIDQVKSITSEEEIEDASETLEEDQHGVMAEDQIESNVIRVFVREKEKEMLSVSQNLVLSVDQKCSQREKLVESITNDLLQSLLNECLRTAAPTHTPSQDAMWNRVVINSLHEATIDIMSIYRRRIQMSSSQSKDVRTRVCEILAETHVANKLRAEGRIKEMMTTTYGVLSPEDSPCCSPSLLGSPVQQSPTPSGNEDTDTTYNKMAEKSALTSNLGKANDAPMGLMGENTVDSEGCSQEWFDEDFGLTRSRREAEELRRQQLQIEQEIEQLQQQQAQVQEQIPYYYVREIPNKPPPPYTPPGQAPRLLSSSTSLATAVEEVRSVCSDRPVVLKAITSAIDQLYEARSRGQDFGSLEPPSSILDAGFGLSQLSHISEQDLVVYKNNAKVYRRFLFDLAKELVLNAYSIETEDPRPPWLRPENWVRRRKALAVIPKTKEMLHEAVSRQVLVLFGFVPKASKENLTIRWSRKKRDHVDELLVRESQEEERQWTNYEQDEAVVKNNVTLAILDSLLDDTVQVLGDVFRRREQRQHCSVY